MTNSPSFRPKGMRKCTRSLRLIWPIALSILSAGLSPAQASPPLKKPDKATIEKLQTLLPDLMHRAVIPGLSIALIRDGKTYWIHGFGIRNTQTGEPVTVETTFEAASLSKPVLAFGVLKLVDAGKLDLDKPLSDYLPKPYIEGDPRLNKITARFVLSHRSGFPNWRGSKPLSVHFTPGERFSYSGEGFVYLARVVEQITGRPLNDFMTETVFIPLGMTSSSYVWRSDYDARSATGHNADGEPEEKWKPKDPNPAASLQTTAKDYALFVAATLRGTGLKPGTLKEMEAPEIAVDPDCVSCIEKTPEQLSKSIFWGLGWGIERTSAGDAIWHWGDNGVFKCMVLAYPKRKFGVVMFANSENGLAIMPPVMEAALGGTHPEFAWIKVENYDSPGMRFVRAVHDKGPEPSIAEFRQYLNRREISEQTINRLGYRLLQGKKVADAIRIFQLNVELYPNSSIVYDSLAEAYATNGDKVRAIENYKKSLELDATNQNAMDQLKKLGAN
jgi:CubicO group peptidase (beta-lactamase class C family)